MKSPARFTYEQVRKGHTWKIVNFGTLHVGEILATGGGADYRECAEAAHAWAKEHPEYSVARLPALT